MRWRHLLRREGSKIIHPMSPFTTGTCGVEVLCTCAHTARGLHSSRSMPLRFQTQIQSLDGNRTSRDISAVFCPSLPFSLCRQWSPVMRWASLWISSTRPLVRTSESLFSDFLIPSLSCFLVICSYYDAFWIASHILGNNHSATGMHSHATTMYRSALQPATLHN